MSHQKKHKAQAPRVSSSRWPSRRKLLLLLALIVLLVIGAWFAVQQVQIRVERDKFMQAKDDLHTLAEQIMTQIGQPAEEKAVQSCGYTSVVVGRGTRFCDVDEYLFYSVDAEQDAIMLAKRISSVISKDEIIGNWMSDDSLTAETILSNSFSLGQFKQCGAQMLFLDGHSVKSNQYPGFIVKTGISGLSININCGANARAEYFPVQK